MRSFLKAALAATIALAILPSCGQYDPPLDLSRPSPQSDLSILTAAPPGTPSVSFDLIAARTEVIGSVTCWLDGDLLMIQYATEGDWYLAETHTDVVGSVYDFPLTKKGNPKVGHFALKQEHAPFTSSYVAEFDLAAAGLENAGELFVAAHTAVQILSPDGDLLDNQGAWACCEPFSEIGLYDEEMTEELERPQDTYKGKGKQLHQREGQGRGNWAMYFHIEMEDLRLLLLWNTLGSEYEVTHSRIGPDGVIVGDLEYHPCAHGDGFLPAPRTGDPNIPDNYIMFSGLDLQPCGCVEFWYHPDWIDYYLGHVATLFVYGLYNNSNHGYFQVGYNDWQNLFGCSLMSPGGTNRIAEYSPPTSIPGWSTVEPFHMAFTWDASEPAVPNRLRVFVNGVEMATSRTIYDPNPDFSGWLPDAVFFLGTRTVIGDWNRHHWEGSEGIIDNIKIWRYAKTDFSDRFVE